MFFVGSFGKNNPIKYNQPTKNQAAKNIKSLTTANGDA